MELKTDEQPIHHAILIISSYFSLFVLLSAACYFFVFIIDIQACINLKLINANSVPILIFVERSCSKICSCESIEESIC